LCNVEAETKFINFQLYSVIDTALHNKEVTEVGGDNKNNDNNDYCL